MIDNNVCLKIRTQIQIVFFDNFKALTLTRKKKSVKTRLRIKKDFYILKNALIFEILWIFLFPIYSPLRGQ